MVINPQSACNRVSLCAQGFNESRIVEGALLWHSGSPMNTRAHLGRLAILLLLSHAVAALGEPGAPATNTVRVAAAQAARRVIDFRLKPDEALAAVDRTLVELERIVDRAGEAKCDALVLPEDTPGLLNWVGANETLAKEVLPKAVNRMLERLELRRRTAPNVSRRLQRSYRERWRNLQHCLPARSRRQGDRPIPQGLSDVVGSRRAPAGKFVPGFPTPDLGTAGMLICYDLVVPETARCLALAGADIIFFPTMGGAGHRRR